MSSFENFSCMILSTLQVLQVLFWND